MTKTLVTGGTGFLGSNLLHQLVARGERVRALRRKSSPMDLVKTIEDKIEWVEGDILDIDSLEDAMEGIDYVYHCAAKVSFHLKDREALYKINIEGTANVVNMALDFGVKKLLHVSSIAALGRKPNQTHYNESAHWENSPLNSQYAISKFRAECEVWRGLEEGLNVVVVNPSIIMGPCCFLQEGTGRLFERAYNKMIYYPPGTTGFVDVRDVARAMIGLMNSDIIGERFILNGENMPFKDVFTQMANHFNVKPPYKEASQMAANILWRVEWLRSKLTGARPILTKETAMNLSKHFYYDNHKIRQQLGFEFTPIAQTIQETALKFMEAKKAGRNWM